MQDALSDFWSEESNPQAKSTIRIRKQESKPPGESGMKRARDSNSDLSVLIDTVKNEDVAHVRKFSEKSVVIVNGRNKHGDTPLDWACTYFLLEFQYIFGRIGRTMSVRRPPPHSKRTKIT